MPRNLPTPLITEITSNTVSPCFLVDLTLVSGTVHVWSGYGSITWNGNTYGGVGPLGSVGDITESSEVKADGTTITLSGIDPTLLNDSLNDIQQDAPATVWLGAFSNGQVTAAYPIFGGKVDRPSVLIGPDSLTIQIALENRMVNHQRATMRRYTMADQRSYYPDDIGFSWVEVLNDIALVWG